MERFYLAFDLSCEQLCSVLVWEQSNMVETLLSSRDAESAGQQQEASGLTLKAMLQDNPGSQE